MKLIIDISEETYKATCNGSMLPPDVKNVVDAIKNSTSLEDEFEKIKTELRDEKESYMSEIGKCGFTEGITFAIETIDEYIGDLK